MRTKELIQLIADFLVSEYEESVRQIPEDIFHEQIENGILRAQSHGFKNEATIMAFVAVMFEVAPNFDEHPTVKEFLSQSEDEPEELFERLFSTLPEAVWDEVEDQFDASAWYPDEDFSDLDS